MSATSSSVTASEPPTATPSITKEPHLTKIQRTLAKARKRNHHLPNGAKSLVLEDDGFAGLVGATLSPCHVPSASEFYQPDNGCFIAASVVIASGADGYYVNPDDFYILDKNNRRYNEGDGDSLVVPMNGSRLDFSELNKNEVSRGFVVFDAPAHGRLVYRPSFANAPLIWFY
jgi:hypothetical protein